MAVRKSRYSVQEGQSGIGLDVLIFSENPYAHFLLWASPHSHQFSVRRLYGKPPQFSTSGHLLGTPLEAKRLFLSRSQLIEDHGVRFTAPSIDNGRRGYIVAADCHQTNPLVCNHLPEPGGPHLEADVHMVYIKALSRWWRIQLLITDEG